MLPESNVMIEKFTMMVILFYQKVILIAEITFATLIIKLHLTDAMTSSSTCNRAPKIDVYMEAHKLI